MRVCKTLGANRTHDVPIPELCGGFFAGSEAAGLKLEII
jgi:hypothetical protein